jgi:hypothetical protein
VYQNRCPLCTGLRTDTTLPHIVIFSYCVLLHTMSAFFPSRMFQRVLRLFVHRTAITYRWAERVWIWFWGGKHGTKESSRLQLSI